jgi:hypothetical protein
MIRLLNSLSLQQRSLSQLKSVDGVNCDQLVRLCSDPVRPVASDVLNRNGFCQKDRDSYRNQEDAGDDARPSICRECVRASQTDNASRAPPSVSFAQWHLTTPLLTAVTGSYRVF